MGEPKNILVTGPPGCGKSTLVERVVRRLARPVAGFFTREIREAGRRVGFAVATMDGREGVLAHQNIKGAYRVGRYGVRLDDLDNLAVPTMFPDSEDAIVVVDEIGKMECFSAVFKEAVLRALDAPNPLFGAIALKGSGFIVRVKSRPDVELVRLTPQNRDGLVEVLVERLQLLASPVG